MAGVGAGLSPRPSGCAGGSHLVGETAWFLKKLGPHETLCLHNIQKASLAAKKSQSWVDSHPAAASLERARSSQYRCEGSSRQQCLVSTQQEPASPTA